MTIQTLLILSRDAETYSELIESAGLPGIRDIRPYQNPEQAGGHCTDATIILGEPGRIKEILPECKALQWIQSTWAGVTPLVGSGCRSDYRLTGLKGIFGPLMSEYVFCHILMHERRVMEQSAFQHRKQWMPLMPGRLKGKHIGIMGLGSIGSDIARTARFFRMKTSGCSRSGSSSDDVDAVFSQDRIIEFVNSLDYLIAVLPDTPETFHLIDRSVFNAMRPGALFINVGRGSCVNESDLIQALLQGHIAGAVLDVFQEEPLPADHPLWTTPGATITPHTAAISYPDDIAPIFIDNYHRFITGAPLKFQVDFQTGY